jgi:hypothetical protein
MKLPSASLLDGHIGKHISTICTCGYIADAENHCAHFVCHITELHFGTTCRSLTGKGQFADSANVRVHEVFRKCRRVGTWDSKPAEITSGFIFVTQAGNVHLKKKEIDNVRNKHIGLFIGSDVWQYKNRLKQVVKQTPEEFKKHYEGKGYEIYFGEFPLDKA